MSVVDAVVIGSGPNGLVAANLLVDAGWQVVLLETQSRPGGAVASDEDVRPGWVHDTFSAFYPMAVASPVIRGLDLERHGLEWMRAPAAVGTPMPGGGWALLHRDRADTAAGLDALAPGDGDAWLALCSEWDAIGEELVAALLSPFPPIRHGAAALARVRRAGGVAFLRRLLGPAATLARDRFAGTAPGLLIGGNAAHSDISVDAPGSALIGWLLSMLAQHHGFPVPRGGAGMLSAAMVQRFARAGGELRLATRADRVLVRDGRAVGVRTSHGDVIRVRHAVVADVSAPALYGDLLRPEDVPARTRRWMRRFRWDPGTVKVDWALSGPIPWQEAPAAQPGTVHVTDSLDQIAADQARIAAGVVPAAPFLVVGQMALADPSRAPAGAESAWAYTHVPQRFGADETGVIRGVWDHDDAQRMADRIQQRMERAAPGFGSMVLARRVLTPWDLHARDENLVNGALNGGTAALRQQAVLRPMPGLGRAETPVRGLYLGSASAHPGGAVHGACGANAARAALAHAQLRRR
ncbi:phytoene desaturase family protein [Nocardioides terrisoli]|uniref:phytoene desaturase family protein n=1 Tax=Nocardioides terrisoli TaxID=3388267 RepID=UPI00287BA1B3|nr:NAD(P)/FAD-dependent oxidoreductase [Nocardioides marmorisolisilvae]